MPPRPLEPPCPPLASLLTDAFGRRASGALRLESEEGVAWLMLEEGVPVGALGSGAAFVPLSRTLLERRLVSPDDVAQAIPALCGGEALSGCLPWPSAIAEAASVQLDGAMRRFASPRAARFEPTPPLAFPRCSPDLRRVSKPMEEPSEPTAEDGWIEGFDELVSPGAADPASLPEIDESILIRDILDVSQAARLADEAMGGRRYDEAAALYERAFALGHDPLRLAQRAWAMYLGPFGRAFASEAKALLDEALRIDPACTRAAAWRDAIRRGDRSVP